MHVLLGTWTSLIVIAQVNLINYCVKVSSSLFMAFNNQIKAAHILRRLILIFRAKNRLISDLKRLIGGSIKQEVLLISTSRQNFQMEKLTTDSIVHVLLLMAFVSLISARRLTQFQE